jgi:hypothetical protein
LTSAVAGAPGGAVSSLAAMTSPLQRSSKQARFYGAGAGPSADTIERMRIDPDALSSLAAEYTRPMTSIRGRRVQRLIKREFAGAERVLVARTGDGVAAVLGTSALGAALCVTDGRGKGVSVFKWRHDSPAAFETRFDLLKDSLPELATRPVPMVRVPVLAFPATAPGADRCAAS